jgi:uncharacterized protein with NAD-binding domain and iron-sulfur cluster
VTDATDVEVAVLGGGVGGLSVAQELGERGVDVRVFEARERFGGKARSVPGPERGGTPLPAEHGFRFFPGFYTHVTDTMARIPDGEGTVADNLVATTEMLVGLTDGDLRTMDVETPRSLDGWRRSLRSLFGNANVPSDEAVYFVNRLLYVLTACDRRREEQLDDVTWWEFVDAESMSPEYRKFLGYGLTQALVAMRPQVSSARTIGQIYLQMIRGLLDPSLDADRLLDGPTNDVWIDPWVDYLRELGVDLQTGRRVTAVEADGRRVTGVRVDGERVTADQYVLALPVGATADLLTPELRRAAPSLSGVEELDTAWMNGLQFYLDEDVPTAHGHGVYYDSPWALTSVSQRQFWEEYDFDAHDDVEGVLSVIVSEWDEPGVVYGKLARECTREELVEEVWTQLKAHLNRDGREVLRDDHRVDVHVDAALEFDDGVTNDDPLLINTVGSLRHRPPAATDAPNLTVAADYVRTNTDLASMESANEAARRATNAVLDRTGVDAPRAAVHDLREPAPFAPLKRQDELRYRLGLPHPGEATPTAWRAYRTVAGALSGRTR